MKGSSSSGVANMIAGTANKVTNSNGTIVMGAGNSVKIQVPILILPHTAIFLLLQLICRKL